MHAMLTPEPRVRYHNRTKVLLVYLLAWGLAIAVPVAALLWLYPYKLAGSAPEMVQALTGIAVALPDAARETLSQAAQQTGAGGEALRAMLTARDVVWRYTVGTVVGAAWLLSLIWQLLWRARFSHPRHGARSVQRAVAAYRLSMLVVLGICALGALAVYLLGLRLVAGRTEWDYLIYFCGFVTVPLAAMACFRLAAPPAISGRRAYFKRL